MELRLPLEMSPGREAACRAVFGTWGCFRTMHGKTAPSCGLHSQAGVRRGVRASGSYQEGTGKSGSYGMWNHPRGHVWNVFVRPASSSGATGRSGTPSRQSRGVDPPVQIRRGERAQRRGCRKTSVFLSSETGISGNFVGRIKGAKCPFDLQFLTRSEEHTSELQSPKDLVCRLLLEKKKKKNKKNESKRERREKSNKKNEVRRQ